MGERITRAERAAQIGALVAAGLTTREIADDLGLQMSYIRGIITDPDDIQRNLRCGRIQPDGRKEYVSLEDVPFEERVAAAQRACREASSTAERYALLAYALWPTGVQQRVLVEEEVA